MAARKPAKRSKRRPPAPRPKARGRKRAARPARRSAAARRRATSPRRRRAAAARTRTRRPTRVGRTKARRPAVSKRTQRAKAKRARRPARARTQPRAVAAAPVARPAPRAPRRLFAAEKSEAGRPLLERERRRLSDAERLEPESEAPSEANRLTAEARSGRRGLQAALARHSETDPSLTAGDIDARWDDAYAVGDEAPGGDNPTPDQDRVDDIGKALGVTYQDAEELKGSDKIAERDRHRWELDPASSDDWPHDKGEE